MNQPDIKVAVGCGKRRYPDYIHVDKYPDNINEVVKMDADNLSFTNNMISTLYACHVLEYYDWEDIEKKVLPCWYRVLKPGGILRVAVPNFQSMAILYAQDISQYYENRYRLDKFIGPLFGKMTVGDTTIYHKCCLDYSTLYKLLKNSGFANIHQYDWRNTDTANIDDHSQAYLPHMDKKNGTLISLNVECEKPK